MSFTYILNNEHETLRLAKTLAPLVRNGTLIFLQGPLGAGKTAFARGFLIGLGYQNKVKSPTYTLVEFYELKEKNVAHFDLYRIKSTAELSDMGFEEYLNDKTITLVEWPEKGDKFLPSPDLICQLDYFANTKRQIILKATSLLGDKLLQYYNRQIHE
jgi:tRNA threonylcarbamoyladenosine biosynthesis protein TsaE